MQFFQIHFPVSAVETLTVMMILFGAGELPEQGKARQTIAAAPVLREQA